MLAKKDKIFFIINQLKERNRKLGLALPPLFYITEKARQKDTLAVIKLLPQGSAVILRDYGVDKREELGKEIKKICTKRKLKLLVAGDYALAKKLKADGMHFSERNFRTAQKIKQIEPGFLITTSVHKPISLFKYNNKVAHAVLITPLFKTESHPGRKAFGPLIYNSLARKSHLPVIALAGINHSNISIIRNLTVAGVSLVSGLEAIDKQE